MTDTIDSSASTGAAKSGLAGKLLPELRTIASGLGIKPAGMKKADLVSAIRAAQGGATGNGAAGNGGAQRNSEVQNKGAAKANGSRDHAGGDADTSSRPEQASREEPASESRSDTATDSSQSNRGDRSEQRDRGDRSNRQSNRQDERADQRQDEDDGGQSNQNYQGGQESNRNQGGGNNNRNQGAGGNNNRNQNQPGGNRNDRNDRNDMDEDGSRRNRRRRGRDRDRGGNQDRGGLQVSGGNTRGSRNEPDTTVLEDDVLIPAAGILDVLDNYAFVRTSGYLPGSDDCYVSLSMVRRLGLRRGDAITGQVRQPREGERREKFNPMVTIDTVNGADPEAIKNRVEFQKLTPLYASERLRLETDPTNLIGRVIDIAAPIGKGQRGLIVSPSKAGKTMIMQSIANSITKNNPECHLMVVLVDERPEEVTDFERSVKGEVISSTFDRPASDHTTVAELAIERAKRLVEMGHDVVVLLDGITRLGRAYNLAAPASGRILSGGVDSAALYPPKRFFGAARNIENGGSLTILATALIESGSKMDEVIFEEFKGTGNMEIRLRRDFADKRIFPAIDAVQSGTRREELLMTKEELAIIWKLRRVLSGLDSQQALELLLERLKKSQTNLEFLMQVQKTTPTTGGNGD
ncbi:MAG: transcription termination factor Rho [Marmoricola sp.]